MCHVLLRNLTKNSMYIFPSLGVEFEYPPKKNMSKRKGTEHIVHLKKFLNHNSDCLKRLKSLRNELGSLMILLLLLMGVVNVYVVDKVPVTEAKQIINEYSSSVFYVLYTSFTSVETTLNDRGTLE